MYHSEELRKTLEVMRASNPPLRKKNNRRTPPPPEPPPISGRSQSGASGYRQLALPAGRRTAMPGRLRRRESELHDCIQAAELAGMDYRQAIRPLLAELRDIIVERTAAEARRGAITPASLSVCLETVNPPHGAAVALEGQN